MKKALIVSAIALIIIVSCDHGRNMMAEREREAREFEAKMNDINNYPVVKIGEQLWLAHNLGVGTFKNGDTIPQASTLEEWIAAGDEQKAAWMYFEFWSPYIQSSDPPLVA